MNPSIAQQILQASDLAQRNRESGDFVRVPFYYHVNFEGIASGDMGTQNVTLNTDSYFLLRSIRAVVIDITAHTVTLVPNTRITVTKVGSGMTLYDNRGTGQGTANLMLLGNVWGTSSLPGMLPASPVLAPGDTLQVFISSVFSANRSSFQVVLAGEKRFTYTGMVA